MSRASASVLFFSMRDNCSGDSSPLADLQLMVLKLLSLFSGVGEVNAIFLLGGKQFSSPSSTVHALLRNVSKSISSGRRINMHGYIHTCHTLVTKIIYRSGKLRSTSSPAFSL